MERIAVEDYRIVVIADGVTDSVRNNNKGHLYERFIALLLREYGYDTPGEKHMNPTSEGIELDVEVSNSFTGRTAVVECKAYSTNVSAQALTSFYGKLKMEQEVNPDVEGYLFVLPRLVKPGHEKAKAAQERNPMFHYYDAQQVVEFLVDRGLVRPAHLVLPSDVVPSDPVIVITEDGLYSCATVLDPYSRRPEYILVWGRYPDSVVPETAKRLIETSEYGNGLGVRPIDDNHVFSPTRSSSDFPRPVVVTVRGSSEDFEYEFPASPEFFVGRRNTVSEMTRILEAGKGSLVLNAPSGSGKSSLALKLKDMLEERGGFGIVIDSRTASSPLFVTEALRIAAQRAEEAGLIVLPADSSWASLQSATATIDRATWNRRQPLMIFFDQFENVFQDVPTTREFRDLTFVAQELMRPVLLGFAWKTDIVGWTESHPFHLRDEIREKSVKVTLSPMGARDIDGLLRRLRKRLGQDIIRELSQRLREYSQGLPWLFKKFAGHVIREIEERGTTQEQLVSEAINIQSLFESELSLLNPTEQDALRYVASNAPVSALEVTERYGSAVITSLLHAKRLLVAVDEKLDTYSDIFRDFLKFGRVSIQDSYTIGLNPQAVAPVVVEVMKAGGDLAIADVATAVGATTGSIVNTSRTLRLLGISVFEPNRIRLAQAIVGSVDQEAVLRRTVADAMKQHKAYSTFLRLAERHSDGIDIPLFASELAQAYPAIDKRSERTWATYARAFALWFEYAGIAQLDNHNLRLPSEDHAGKGTLLMTSRLRAIRVESINGGPGPSLRLLELASRRAVKVDELSRGQQRAARNLRVLGLVQEQHRDVLLPAPDVFVEGKLAGPALLRGLLTLPGGPRAVSLLEGDPTVDNLSLGRALIEGPPARLKDSTIELNGKHFRSWARQAGVSIARARAVDTVPTPDVSERDSLF
ncbi:restriction endonuclease [Solwaraspora sp. WMMD1047]|uniref:nSTAND1 domain-containing NTPase n=1 Tax=Solwaraspora sp. WMMD1047 TaxID=3016102 RepID=UPI002415E9EF|nr:restriction endonuclease [Solwaraspora sp. WMMD1047]MDG4831560.1 restriction endonuclease [Solwaraspora sp. WMMD1047]